MAVAMTNSFDEILNNVINLTNCFDGFNKLELERRESQFIKEWKCKLEEEECKFNECLMDSEQIRADILSSMQRLEYRRAEFQMVVNQKKVLGKKLQEMRDENEKQRKELNHLRLLAFNKGDQISKICLEYADHYSMNGGYYNLLDTKVDKIDGLLREIWIEKDIEEQERLAIEMNMSGHEYALNEESMRSLMKEYSALRSEVSSLRQSVSQQTQAVQASKCEIAKLNKQMMELESVPYKDETYLMLKKHIEMIRSENEFKQGSSQPKKAKKVCWS